MYRKHQSVHRKNINILRSSLDTFMSACLNFRKEEGLEAVDPWKRFISLSAFHHQVEVAIDHGVIQPLCI